MHGQMETRMEIRALKYNTKLIKILFGKIFLEAILLSIQIKEKQSLISSAFGIVMRQVK
jgi:hypothetical protein